MTAIMSNIPSVPSTHVPKRIEAIDICRGLAVIFMVLVHTHYMYSDQATREDSLFGTLVWAVALGAPVFLFAMGLSFTFSRNQSLASAIKRGLLLLGFGFAANFIWFAAPLLAGVLPEDFIIANHWNTALSTELIIRIIGTGDILHLAGLSLIIMGLIRSLTRSALAVFSVSIFMAILSGFIQGYRPGIPGLDYLCDLLWGIEWNVYFPVVPWASSILMGMAFGLYIKQLKGNTDQAFKYMLPIGLVGAAIGGALCAYNPELHFRDFFHAGPGITLTLLGLTCVIYWLAYKFQTPLATSKLGRFAIHCSRRVTSIYILHMLLLSWLLSLLGFKQHQALFTVVFSCAILAATLAADVIYRKLASLLSRQRPRTINPNHSGGPSQSTITE